jgi:hypothetical protein
MGVLSLIVNSAVEKPPHFVFAITIPLLYSLDG